MHLLVIRHHDIRTGHMQGQNYRVCTALVLIERGAVRSLNEVVETGKVEVFVFLDRCVDPTTFCFYHLLRARIVRCHWRLFICKLL